MPQPSGHRSIADRSWDIRQSLLDLLDKTTTTEAPIASQEVEDVLDRFKLWTGNLGALHQAHKRISLESRLADSPEVQGQICEHLDDMQEAIQDLLTLCSDACEDIGSNIKDEQEDPGSVDLPWDDFVLVPDTEWASSKAEAISILSMVSECLKALFRIGILVRKATPRDRFERALQQSEFEFSPQFDINYVQERYPKLASHDSQLLASRLGGANAKRRQFINYGRDHKTKLEVEATDPTAGAMTIVQSSKATTFAVPGNLPPSEFLNLPVEAEDDSVSLVSASTAFNNDTSLRLPSLADLGPDGKYFECPICFTLQSFRMEKSWKIHAYRDLKAYACTSGEEECEHKMFGDRDSWFNHELKNHHSLYMCKLCGIQCTATKMLQQHILGEHGNHSDEEVLSLIEHGRLVPSQLKAQDCPFCDDWGSILSHRRHQREGRTSSDFQEADILVSLTHFKRHVATHQEQLAIFAVPRTVDEDEENSHGTTAQANSEAVSSKEDNSRSTDKGTQPMEGSTPSQPCVYVTGLPREVTEADIKNHFRLGGFRGVTEVTLMDICTFIEFEDPDDVHSAVRSMHGSTLLGARINVLPGLLSRDPKTHLIDEFIDDTHADNIDPGRAIGYINAAEGHFRTTLLPMCEEFIASPPSDPQQRQDQFNLIVTRIRDEVWLTVKLIPEHNGEEVMARKTEVLGAVDNMLDRIYASAISNFDGRSSVDVDNSHIVHQRPKQWKNGPTPIDLMSIEAFQVKNSGSSPQLMDGLGPQPRHGPNYNKLLHLLNDMQNHQSSWPFLMPVNKNEVQDYYDVIKEPMDLSTMEQKLEADLYITVGDFIEDATLIFKNCRQYNEESTPYVKSANKLENFMWSKIQEFPGWGHDAENQGK